ncbi:MAG: hypothetical protein RLZZ511_3716 [Cyanobacteriota bacterium]|jgi:hypothetical protein
MSTFLYQEDHFVVLETNQPEQFLTAIEMQTKLVQVLGDRHNDLPPGLGLEAFSTLETQAQHLINTVCELALGPSEYLQWYAVRLEK